MPSETNVLILTRWKVSRILFYTWPVEGWFLARYHLCFQAYSSIDGRRTVSIILCTIFFLIILSMVRPPLDPLLVAVRVETRNIIFWLQDFFQADKCYTFHILVCIIYSNDQTYNRLKITKKKFSLKFNLILVPIHCLFNFFPNFYCIVVYVQNYYYLRSFTTVYALMYVQEAEMLLYVCILELLNTLNVISVFKSRFDGNKTISKQWK